jgi:hypothetical protein
MPRSCLLTGSSRDEPSQRAAHDSASILGRWLVVMRDRRRTLLRCVLQRPYPDAGVEEGGFGAAYELRVGTEADELPDEQVVDRKTRVSE